MGKLTKGNKLGNRFSSINQPKKNGRKPSRIQQFVKAFGMEEPGREISKEDGYKLLGWILSCNKTDLERMAQNPDLPISITCQIKAIVEDMKVGKTDTVDKIWDRLWGKASQPMELTGAGGAQLIPDRPMSRKDYEKLLNDLKCGG